MSKQIPLNERKFFEFLIISIGGWLLSFNAGMINSTTLSQSKELSTSPMTGSCTSIGIGLGSSNFIVFGQAIGILFSHIFGGLISGYLVPNRTFYLNSNYGRIFQVGSIVLLLAATTNLLFPNSIFIYFFAAISTGIQNGLTSR